MLINSGLGLYFLTSVATAGKYKHALLLVFKLASCQDEIPRESADTSVQLRTTVDFLCLFWFYINSLIISLSSLLPFENRFKDTRDASHLHLTRIRAHFQNDNAKTATKAWFPETASTASVAILFLILCFMSLRAYWPLAVLMSILIVPLSVVMLN